MNNISVQKGLIKPSVIVVVLLSILVVRTNNNNNNMRWTFGHKYRLPIWVYTDDTRRTFMDVCCQRVCIRAKYQITLPQQRNTLQWKLGKSS